MGHGQAEQSSRNRKGKAVEREGEEDREQVHGVPKKVLFRRGERVAIGASGGKGELSVLSYARERESRGTATPSSQVPVVALRCEGGEGLMLQARQGAFAGQEGVLLTEYTAQPMDWLGTEVTSDQWLVHNQTLISCFPFARQTRPFLPTS